MLFRQRESVDFVKRIRLWLWPRRSFSRSLSYIRKRILRISATPHKVALGFAIGIFLACSPLFGMHIVLAVLFSWILRGNFAAAIIGTIFSNPFTFLLIVMADYKIGYLCLSLFSDVNEISLSQIRTLFDGITLSNVPLLFKSAWNSIMRPMLLGGALLGFILGSLSYIGVYRAIARFQQKRYKKIMKKKRL
ncbi:DUF2062 domain-containing protein [Bartonella doshiae]|uniref:Uncharacterized protein conserved in bacteria (DUF2062) n=2 Tax=Bartonella doshiae TaxID=33044 RepID=A0A380ZCD2_BARDO|nr:DUF2062 domain-containing protein [Bartonella doshiae]EJF81934.1 hypothetical protein MCS_00359 [Bartonella doshiae NCTC 12862 = ATCC 700133]MBB6159354.1 hypothetical protein [Bartonella doshiae]SUV44639.1 Uncharacterized protein conserved in bacteria (DUF2062) [Bartonella doshiae]